ncbi:MAG: UDP-N-acetylmuramate dehydrogenase [Pseudomonadota bacterium]
MSSLPTAVQQEVELAPLTTLGTPCKARFFTSLSDRETLKPVLAWASAASLPVMILGGGSNVVLGERYEGLVIHLDLQGRHVESVDGQSARIRFGAGEHWHDCVMWSLQQGYYGLENLALIPGSMGAAPIQNIGAYGVELKDHFIELNALDLHTGENRRFDAGECRFGYRDSVFKHEARDRYAILDVTLKLGREPAPVLDYPALKEALTGEPMPAPARIAEVICQIRRSKLPDPEVTGNVGSFFKNPVVSKEVADRLRREWPDMPVHPVSGGCKLAAGWLIEACGLKGYRRGNVAVHDRQALVLVNLGGASGREVLALAEKVANTVEEQFAVRLEIEPRVYAAFNTND